MDRVHWIEANVDGRRHDRLAPFDHHRFEVDDSVAVLITYLREANRDRGVLAVIHSAAGHYPPVPPSIQLILADLVWRKGSPPVLSP